MRHYEYKCFNFVAVGGYDNVEKFVNQHAAEGWEYVEGLPSPLHAYSERAVANGEPKPVLFRRQIKVHAVVFDSNEQVSQLSKDLTACEKQRIALEQENKMLRDRLEQIAEMVTGE